MVSDPPCVMRSNDCPLHLSCVSCEQDSTAARDKCDGTCTRSWKTQHCWPHLTLLGHVRWAHEVGTQEYGSQAAPGCGALTGAATRLQRKSRVSWVAGRGGAPQGPGGAGRRGEPEKLPSETSRNLVTANLGACCGKLAAMQEGRSRDGDGRCHCILRH